MDIGLHIADFTYPSGPAGLAEDLTRVVTTAEEAGFTRVSVMDHVWQIGVLGPPEHEMLEAYTTLGYLAARTSRVELLAWVTAVSYREPGMLAKLVSTLDVLSGGRALLGIGAAWNGEEARGLGLPFPPTAERFERLEETLQICSRCGARRRALRRHALPARAHAQPAPAAAPPLADPDRWGWREEDPAVGRAVRAGVQPVQQPRTRAQARRAARPLRDRGPPYDDIEKTVMSRSTSGSGARTSMRCAPIWSGWPSSACRRCTAGCRGSGS